MEATNHKTNVIIDEIPYTIEWGDIEHVEMDYDNYLNDVENFFREDCKEDILEEEAL